MVIPQLCISSDCLLLNSPVCRNGWRFSGLRIIPEFMIFEADFLLEVKLKVHNRQLLLFHFQVF